MNEEFFAGRAAELAIHARAASGIVSKARELGVDLVVVGSHGGGPVSRLLLGSVAEAVAADAPCSVLVVRQ
jgi:nucleotide-binding universal stress UspA family protein